MIQSKKTKHNVIVSYVGRVNKDASGEAISRTLSIVIDQTEDRQKEWGKRKLSVPNTRNETLNLKDYDSAVNGKRNIPKRLDPIVAYFNKTMTELADAIDAMPVWNPEKFLRVQSNTTDVSFTSICEAKIKEEIEAKNSMNARTYRSKLNKLQEFMGKERITFEELTVSTLTKYNEWLSCTNTFRHFTVIRHLFNKAIAQELISGGLYPFSRTVEEHKTKFVIDSKRRKHPKRKPIPSHLLSDIFSYSEGLTEEQLFFRDMFAFGYYMGGANLIDLMKLRYEDIDMLNSIISFTRNKTKEKVTTDGLGQVTVQFVDKAKAIVQKWGNPLSPKNFVFPFIYEEEFPEAYKALDEGHVKLNTFIDRKKYINNDINDTLKIISKGLMLNEDIKWYWARHSVVNNLREGQWSTENISKIVGSSAETVSAFYSSALTKSEREKAGQALAI